MELKRQSPKIPFMWLDKDQGSLSKIMESPLPSSVVIEKSPGRYQIFWKHKEPLDPLSICQVENILKRLAIFFEGDLRSRDASRILRCPRTLNFKYRQPFRVTLKSLFRNREYNLIGFDDFLPETKPVHQVLSNHAFGLQSPANGYFDAEALIENAIKTAHPRNRNQTGFLLAYQAYQRESKEPSIAEVVRQAERVSYLFQEDEGIDSLETTDSHSKIYSYYMKGIILIDGYDMKRIILSDKVQKILKAKSEGKVVPLFSSEPENPFFQAIFLGEL